MQVLYERLVDQTTEEVCGVVAIDRYCRSLLLYERFVGQTTEEVCKEVAIETHR